MKRATAGGVLALLLSCGGAPHRDADPRPVETAADEPPIDAGAPERQREGILRRSLLDPVLAAGPGRFLGTFEVEARRRDGRFAGWTLVRAPWDDVDLLPGDVVVAVNRRTLERPLELESLWTELATADALVIEVERGTERFTLRYVVADDRDPPFAAP